MKHKSQNLPKIECDQLYDNWATGIYTSGKKIGFANQDFKARNVSFLNNNNVLFLVVFFIFVWTVPTYSET